LYDRVLVAVGRVPNSADLGLENTRVELDDKGFVKVNERQQTNDPGIYAIGDIAGGILLAHKANKEAHIAVDSINGGNSVPLSEIVIPAVVFTDPELAWCGLTEAEAKERGVHYEVSKFPWAASGRAMTLDRTEGMTKLILDPQTERVLGVGIVGAGAGELIAEGVLAVEMAALAKDLALTIHPHPTLSETVMEAAEVFFGTSTDIYRPKKS
jgi:dihydrolipoamide dehydrogenase